MNHYMGSYSPVGDPAFRALTGEIGVIDWAEFEGSGAEAREIHDFTRKFGVARHGLSYPFTDSTGQAVMFSVDVGCQDQQWPRERARIIGVFRGFAHFFHARAKPLVAARRSGGAAISVA